MPIDPIDVIKLVVVAAGAWWLIGGWPSLRQPRVFIPLLLMIGLLVGAELASGAVDTVREGGEAPLSAPTLANVALVALLAAAGCLAWAVVAGMRLRRSAQRPEQRVAG